MNLKDSEVDRSVWREGGRGRNIVIISSSQKLKKYIKATASGHYRPHLPQEERAAYAPSPSKESPSMRGPAGGDPQPRSPDPRAQGLSDWSFLVNNTHSVMTSFTSYILEVWLPTIQELRTSRWIRTSWDRTSKLWLIFHLYGRKSLMVPEQTATCYPPSKTLTWVITHEIEWNAFPSNAEACMGSGYTAVLLNLACIV